LSSIQWRLPDTLQQLHDYCRSKRQGAELPRYADIDVAEIPLVLPHVALLEPIENGDDFRYLFTGAALFAAVGVDSSGKLVSECLPAGSYLDYLLGILREAFAERRPLFSESSFRSPLLSNRWTSRLVVPAAGSGSAVQMLVVAQIVGGSVAVAESRPYGDSVEFEEGVRVLLE
jgi:hypothetical protein